MGKIIYDLESLWLPIKQLVYNLEKFKCEGPKRQTCESYLAHEDYDIVVSITLLPKKSQYDLGMRMFNE